jgi:hypothetical protein
MDGCDNDLLLVAVMRPGPHRDDRSDDERPGLQYDLVRLHAGRGDVFRPLTLGFGESPRDANLKRSRREEVNRRDLRTHFGYIEISQKKMWMKEQWYNEQRI